MGLLASAAPALADGDCAKVGEEGVVVDPNKCAERGPPMQATPGQLEPDPFSGVDPATGPQAPTRDLAPSGLLDPTRV